MDAAAAEVEELHGVPVELVRTGDVPLDDRVEALVLAAREAMANAAKHSGADQVSAFVDVGDDEIAIFVRDRGSGFDPEAVPAGAHGIAESIRGRMTRAGGTATITSSGGRHRGRAAPREAAVKRRVVLVDDHDLFRAGVRSELGDAVEIVGEAGSVAEAVPLIRELDPDVVLLDVHLPDGGGHAVIAQVAPERPGRPLPRALRLGRGRGRDRRDPRRRARLRDEVDLGRRPDRRGQADGRRRRGLLAAARRASSSTRSAPARPPVDPELDTLTTREREVLQLIARGYRYKEIAARLHLSVKTVETHVSAVLRKLQLSNRHELTRWAAERRLI